MYILVLYQLSNTMSDTIKCEHGDEIIKREDGRTIVIVRDNSWRVPHPDSRYYRSKLYPTQECFVCQNETDSGCYVEFKTTIPPFVKERTDTPMWVCDPCLGNLDECKSNGYCCSHRWDWKMNERIWTYDVVHISRK